MWLFFFQTSRTCGTEKLVNVRHVTIKSVVISFAPHCVSPTIERNVPKDRHIDRDGCALVDYAG